MTTPAGWYPSGDGNERYWDGTAWTEQIRATSSPPAPTSPGTQTNSSPVPWFKRTWVIAAAALLLGIGLGSAATSGGSDDENLAAASNTETPNETDPEPAPAQDKVTET